MEIVNVQLTVKPVFEN